MDAKCVHHIEFGVQNGLKHVENFLTKYKFQLAGVRCTAVARQWLLCSHAVCFVITQLTRNAARTVDDPYVHSWSFPAKQTQPVVRDSVFNVALRVKNLDACLKRLSNQGVHITKPLQTLSDSAGSVRVCSVKSCVGNVVHTLVDDSNYSGLFLPGFEPASDSDVVTTNTNEADHAAISPACDLHHIDHVTFCCEIGSSASVLDWYEGCFGMKRFFINSDESADEGFVISGEDIGMRLKAMEYWKCAETGLSTGDSADGSIKFVIAEELPNQGVNQIGLFLVDHGGPGIQHVGLHTNDIISAVSFLQANGVQFNEAPYTYYTEVGRLDEMVALGMNVELLKKNGILVDKESDDDSENTTKSLTQPKSRYLMQKFTRPLFDVDTFFLEVIQRVGATGFGSGNITALWRSVQAYLREKGVETQSTSYSTSQK